MKGSTTIGVTVALLVGSSVIEPTAASGRRPLWETDACKGGAWKTFTPKSEGKSLPACHSSREWRVCERRGYQPLYAWWCHGVAPAKAVPNDFRP